MSAEIFKVEVCMKIGVESTGSHRRRSSVGSMKVAC